jgi:hypothetical protein
MNLSLFVNREVSGQKTSSQSESLTLEKEKIWIMGVSNMKGERD